MNRTASFISTAFDWLIILILVSIVWEIAKNLWTNYGTTSFWLSSLFAGLFGVACWWILGGILYLSAPRSGAQNQPTPTPLQQSMSNVSGGMNYQAGGDINVYHGISEETLRQLINQKAISASAQLAARYPKGYVIFGAADGKIIYDSNQWPSDWSLDWKSLTLQIGKGNVRIFIPSFKIGEAEVSKISYDLPISSLPGITLVNTGKGRLCAEVLDEENGIAVLGIKPQ